MVMLRLLTKTPYRLAAGAFAASLCLAVAMPALAASASAAPLLAFGARFVPTKQG